MSHRPPAHHAAPTMTRKGNRLTYERWLKSAPLAALAAANPASIANCYGLDAAEVASDITGEPVRRERNVAEQFGGAA